MALRLTAGWGGPTIGTPPRTEFLDGNEILSYGEFQEMCEPFPERSSEEKSSESAQCRKTPPPHTRTFARSD